MLIEPRVQSLSEPYGAGVARDAVEGVDLSRQSIEVGAIAELAGIRGERFRQPRGRFADDRQPQLLLPGEQIEDDRHGSTLDQTVWLPARGRAGWLRIRRGHRKREDDGHSSGDLLTRTAVTQAVCERWRMRGALEREIIRTCFLGCGRRVTCRLPVQEHQIVRDDLGAVPLLAVLARPRPVDQTPGDVDQPSLA